MSTNKRQFAGADLQRAIMERLRVALECGSMAQLGPYIGASRQTVSKYCLGSVKIPLLTILNLCESQSLDLKYILTGRREGPAAAEENDHKSLDTNFLRQIIDDQRDVIMDLRDQLAAYKTNCRGDCRQPKQRRLVE